MGSAGSPGYPGVRTALTEPVLTHTDARPDLTGLPFDALGELLDAVGVGRRHASRVFRALHRDRCDLTDVPDLGRHATTLMDATTRVDVAVAERHPAEDGSTRLVFALPDGARVEGVLLPNRHGQRVTLCLSSQVGCAMGCRFCATGTLGLSRSLTAGEIVAQVHAARDLLARTDHRLTHLVFMGMGEPLHNFDALRDALAVLLDGRGEGLAQRNITVSTVGLVGPLRRFSAEVGGRIQMALSLHAGTDATRQAIIPVARAHPMAALREALLEHPRIGQQRWMVEYVLLPGVNDGDPELEALATWMDGLPAVVNLIPFNPFAGAPYRPPSDAEVERAWRRLKALGVPNTVRWPRGRQAHGACGQLMLAGS